MRSQVRVLNVTHVLPDRADDPPAATPAPLAAAADVTKLSFFDAMFVSLRPMQRLFFFDGPDLPPFPALVRSLQSSLAATLAVFPPLAGKLTYRPSEDDVVIDCSLAAVSPGVKFVEAEYDYDDSAGGGGVDMHRLAGDDEHHTEAFVQLVPVLEAGRLPAPVLAVQVTRPAPAIAGGGDGAIVAVGVSSHHAAGDGNAVWQFMRAWSTAAREGSPATTRVISPPPTFDRPALLRHPNGDELAHKFLRMFAPALPSVDYPSPQPDFTRQRRKTYLLRPGQIESLKQHIMLALSEEHDKNASMAAPTTHVAVLSLVWTSLVRAKSMSDGDAYLLFAGDCRRRLRPPLDVGYFGNCIKLCHARARVGDLSAGGDVGRRLVHAAVALQKAIREQLDGGDPLADVEQWGNGTIDGKKVRAERATVVVSSHRFTAYETDFGWGAPRRVELVSVHRMELVAMLAAPAGGVQVSVALDGAHMDAFDSYFRQSLACLPACITR